jgi:[glutamine synthetase] adenylyltransferase / [glutamine synthetase]-adenylyl-L-tyrosine phosphorylase
MTAMAQPTAEGNIWALDARLRPEGENGPLVCSLETYQWYYANRAQLWEMQALTRARAIIGQLQDDFVEMAQSVWHNARQNPELLLRIDGMLERIRRERGSGSDFLDLKTGIGGIIEAEFLVQALQMRENIWEQNWERAVERLRQRAQLAHSDAAQLKNAYAFLRRCELILRRYENRSVSTLPNDPSEQHRVAVRLGYREFDAFRRDYIDARNAIHALYESRIRSVKTDSPIALGGL